MAKVYEQEFKVMLVELLNSGRKVQEGWRDFEELVLGTSETLALNVIKLSI